ncbi:MAG: 4-(cytidine 5'-diphospho)-2-C-methyl-D-erythritol kinase [Hyphomicrobiales bacterium]|nr:4-(cytidine 5'-diphospho)-2-C-methyl-D-erythritol kinase [Hyphomicrobiales bacterium]
MWTRLREPSSDGSPIVEGGLVEFAPAKINLTLAVERRRPDGFHNLASLVAFASIGDELSLAPDEELSLQVTGPFAEAAGAPDANLVLKATRALARRVPNLRQGRFALVKHLPVAAGLGGGSADAAAALRLLAKLNGLALKSAPITKAAQETGSDVPICLFGECRMMSGRGEILGPKLRTPLLSAVLVNPGVQLETARVFAAFAQKSNTNASPQFVPPAPLSPPAKWLTAITRCGNDLESAAIGLAPAVRDASLRLRSQPGCVLARMTGSGTTVFGLFEDELHAAIAAETITTFEPQWWVRNVILND